MSHAELLKTFPERLRAVWKESGAPSLHAFAQLCAVPDSAMRSYIAGKSLPSLETIVAIADACDVSLDALVLDRPRGDEISEGDVSAVVESAVRVLLAGYHGVTLQPEMVKPLAAAIADYCVSHLFDLRPITVAGYSADRVARIIRDGLDRRALGRLELEAAMREAGKTD